MNPATFNRKRLVYVLVILAVVLVPVALFVFRGKFQIPNQSIFKKSLVELKTSYKNPFAKNTQYVNPFDTYKNPFTVSK